MERRVRIAPLGLLAFWVCAFSPASGDPPDWEARYAERAAAVAEGDVRGQFALARWCEQCHRPEEARRHYEIVLRTDPDHARARECLRALGGGAGEQGAPGRHEKIAAGVVVHGGASGRADGSPVRYVLLAPECAAEGKPLPLAIVYSYETMNTGNADAVLGQWSGFGGLVVSVLDAPDSQVNCSVAIAEATMAEYAVDRESILVMDWRSGHEVGYSVGRRPDLFRYGYSDSTWGGSDWPAVPSVSPEMREHLRDVHVYMKLTGEGYKPIDRGYNDTKYEQVRTYWEALGVRDATIERYPRASNPTGQAPDGTCIQGGACGRARQWFERKMHEDAERRERSAEYDRRAAAVREGDVPGLMRLAGWCEGQGLNEEAAAAYRRVLELEPDRQQARRSLERITAGR